MKNKILSIQSKLVYGYVGSNIAEIAIQLHGLDVISFPTVLLATHTGHKPVYGKAIAKNDFDELVKGIEAIGVIKDVSCLITGYIGTEDVLLSASEFVKRIKESYPDIPYICDPVMGDFDQGLYVPAVVAENVQNYLIPLADILTPNFFELKHILGCEPNTIEDLLSAVNKKPFLSDKILVATSCNLEDTPSDKIETIVIRNGQAERIYSKRIDLETTGTGDLFTALLASHIAMGDEICAAVKKASDIISHCLGYISQKGLKEMNAACLVKYIPDK
ncbi:MAG: pyridoxal kinase [Dysgonomonas sp.]